MAKVTQPSNLPAASMPWARQVTGGVNDVDAAFSRFLSDQDNRNRANNANIQMLTTQNALLQQQNAALQAQANYLASLITVSTSVSDTYNTGDVPGDQTVRWTDGGLNCSVTLNVPTGRLLVAYGVGQITINSGSGSFIAYARISVTTPSGFSQQLGNGTRVFVTNNTFMGVPMSSERTFDVPNNEPVTAKVEFGSWSSASDNTGNAQFAVPYIRGQVIPA